MRIKSFLKIFSLFLLFTVFAKPAEASHLFGGEFTYEYVGPSGDQANPFRYKMVYKVYTSQPVGFVNQVNFRFYQKTGGTLISTRQNVFPTSTSPALKLPTPPGCTVADLPQIFLWTYDLTVDLPVSFTGYYATASISARNQEITNLDDAGNTALFTYMEIPSPLNRSKSPVFTDTAVVVIFAGDTTNIINSAFDADGDKLIYSFNNPFDDGNYFSFTPSATIPIRIPYDNSTFSVTKPFGNGGYASINASTGLAKYYAPLAGNYVVSFQVKEYRNINGVDVQIGSTIRDVQIIVKNFTAPPNSKPTISYNGPPSKVISITEGDAIPPITFNFNDANPGQNLKVEIKSTLLDGPGKLNANVNGLNTNTTLTAVPSGTAATFNYTSVCGEANTYFVNFTVSDGVCGYSPTNDTYTIEVKKYKGPEKITGDTTVCTSNQEAYSVPAKATAGYSWRLSGGGNFVGSSTVSSIQVNWTTPGRYKLTALETASGSCRDSVSFFVNVSPGLNVTVNNPAPVCAGTPVTLSAAGATSYSWTDGTNTFSGATVSVSPTANTVYTVTGSNAGGCTSTKTVAVTVNPKPPVEAGNDRSICAGTSTTLTASGAATYSWSDGTNTFAGNNVSVSPSVNTTYTVTGTNASGCTNTDVVTVSVTPAPTVSLASIPNSFCKNAAPVALPAGSTIDNVAATEINPANLSVGNHTILATVSVNGCTGTATKTITVHPLPTPSLAMLAGTYCVTEPAVTLPTGTTINGAPAATFNPAVLGVGSYTVALSETNAGGCSATSTKIVAVNVAPTPSLAFLSNTYCQSAGAVTLDPAQGIYTINGAAPVGNAFNPSVLGPGTYNVAVTKTENGCTGTNSKTVTINATPTPDFGTLAAVYCKDAGVISLNGANTTYTLNGSNAISINPASLSVGNHTVTATTTINGCSATGTRTIAINAIPTPSLAFLNSTYCQNAPAVNLDPAQGIYTINGGAIAGNTFNPATLGPGTYNVAVIKNENGCTGTATKTVTVTPTPTADFGPLLAKYCSNDPAVSLTGVSGSSFIINGTSASSFNPATLGVGNHTVTVTTTNSNGCSVTASRTIPVNPAPVPSLAFLKAEYCVNETAVALPPGTGGNLVNYSINNVSNQTTFDPAVLGVGTHTITKLETTSITGGCMASTSRTITINAVPTPAFTNLNASYCQNEGSVTLTSTLAGSSFTIDGVTTPTIDPSTLSVGNHTVVVSNTNGSNCTGTATQTISIKAVPVANFGTLGTTYCQNDAPVSLAIPGSIFTVNGNTVSTFDPAALGAGNHTVSVTTTSTPDNCSVTATRTVVINPIPVVDLTFIPDSFCKNDPVYFLDQTKGYSYSVGGTNTFGIDPSGLPVGPLTLNVTTTAVLGCATTATKVITINAAPTPSLALLANSYCKNEAAVTLPAGTTINGAAATTFDPAMLATGTYTVVLSETNTAGCNASVSKTVVVNAVPAPSLAFLSNSYCQSAAAVTLDPAQGSYTINGTAPAGNSFNPAVLGPGTFNVVVTKNENGCTGTATKTITINATPTPDFGTLATAYCKSDAAVSLVIPGSTFIINGSTASAFDPAALAPGNYTVSVITTSADGCTVSASRTVAVNALPTPSLAFMANAYCKNDTPPALPVGSGATTITYTVNGTAATAFDPATLPAGNYTVIMTETNGTGCTNSITKTVAVNAVPAPAFTNLNAAYCQNEGLVTLASSLAGSTFTVDGVAATTLDPAVLSVGDHTVIVSNTNGSNCTGTATQTVTIKAVPSANFGTLATSYCLNEAPIQLTAARSTFTVNGTAATEFNPATLGVGNHTVSVTTTSTPDNCSVTATRTVTVKPVPTPGLAFLNNTYCANDAAVALPVPPAGSVTNYSVNGAPLTSAFDPAAFGPGTYNVSVIETQTALGCSGTSTKTVTINATPLADAISGPVSVCPGLAGITYQVVNPRETNYQWIVTGGTIVSGQGTPAVVVNWGGASAATVTAAPVNALGCTGPATTLPVTVNQVLATVQPVGQLTICQNQANQIRYVMPNPTKGSTFTWTVPGATITTPAGNTTGDTIFATWTTPGTFDIVVRENSTTSLANCFGDSSPLRVTVLPSPDATLPIAGPISACENEPNIAYNLTGAPASSTFNWTLTFNGTTTALPGTTASTVINAGAAGQYTLTVVETNASNCIGTPISQVITVTPLPAVDSIYGTAFVCPENLANQLYTVKGVPGTQFDWQVIGGSFTPTTNDSIYVTWDNTATKSITVRPKSASGCFGSPYTQNFTFDPATLVLESVSTAEQNDQVMVVKFSMQGTSANRQPINIFRREFGTSNVVKVGTVANTATSFTDNAVNTKEMLYEYYLESANECGTAITSLVHNPILLSPVQGSEKEKSVSLEWNSYRGWGVNGVASYEIYLKADNGNYQRVRNVSDTTATLNDIAGKGFSQCYRIKATSTDGRVSWSNESCLNFANDLAFYNIFTPNGDTQNDYFVIENIHLYPGNELSVYNRWGNEVFKKKNYDNKWNGNNLSDGTYYYLLKLPNGKSFKGWVEIVR